MLEKKSFLAKDAVLVVDDFAPTGTTADIQRLHREADRLFRAAGNRSGRARMRADGGSRPTYYPRGLIISTGEDIPSGKSLRARLLVLELTSGEIPADALSAAQADAAKGLFAAAMAGYLRWLAPQIDKLRETLPGRQRALRDELVQGAQHRRTPDVAASLIVGWETFLRFAEDARAVTRAAAADMLTRVRAALTDSAEMQGAHLASEEPAQRFLALLRAAISSGRAHVADATTGAEPEDAACWGWQLKVIGSGGYERKEWCPNGERLGWIRDGVLLLDPDAAFAAAQSLPATRARPSPSSSERCGSGWPSRVCSHRATKLGAARCASRFRVCGVTCSIFLRARWPLQLASTRKFAGRTTRRAADFLALASLASSARK